MSEDERIVAHVISKREDYYAVLNIQKAATEEEIKRAYKKMALKLHPDKNKHPKAEEAFKHVSAAHTTLADKEKRRIYDRHGKDGVQAHESGGHPGAHAGGGGGQFRQYHFGGGDGGADLFEEIFSMFLDPRMQQRRQQQQYQQYARQQQRAQQQYQQQQQQQRARARGAAGQQGGGMEFEFGGNPLVAFAPIILFFIFAILLQSSSVFDTSSSSNKNSNGGIWGNDRRAQQERNFRRSLFSLSKTTDHPHERVTTQLPDDLSDIQVPYFVGNQFEYTLSRYGQRLRNVELEVARSKKESLQRRCTHDVKRGNHQSRSQACRDMDRFKKVPSQ